MFLSIAAAAIVAACPWDAPRGTHAVTDIAPSALVDNYGDIPADVRVRLKARMDKLQYDEVVEIGKASITGDYQYSDLRDMHFGAKGQKVCRQVIMNGWTPDERERALIYTDSGYTIAVPTVCRNVSRITRGAPVRKPLTPGPLALDIPSFVVDPLPVATMAIDLPPVEAVALIPDPYTPQSFVSQVSQPEDEWWRISASQVFWEPWARPPLPELFRAPVLRVPADLGTPGAVPGISPPTPSYTGPMPDKPVNLPDDLPNRVAEVPEPGTLLLGFLGLIGVWLMSRRRERDDSLV